jgi:hypothetical protein
MKTVKTEPTNETTETKSQARAWQPGSILFGLILILLGILFLLQNAGVLNLEIDRIWQLWPLFIIAVGLSLMSVRGWLASSITALFIVGALSLAGLVAFGVLTPGSDRATTNKTVEIERKNIAASETTQNASISIKDGAGNITIRSSDTVPLVKASLESNVMDLSQTSRTVNGRQSVELIVENNDGRWWSGDFKNDLNVTLTESLPLSLAIDSGASNINANLTNVTLSRLDIDAGASNLDVMLGSKSDALNVEFDAGMSNIKFKVPKSSGIRLVIDSPMSNLDIPELNKINDDTYESANYSTADKKINFDGNMGMAKFSIEYY